MKKGSMQASSITQCLVLVERSFINMYRDIGYYWLRLGIYIALGFAVGTVFSNIGYGFGSLHVSFTLECITSLKVWIFSHIPHTKDLYFVKQIITRIIIFSWLSKTKGLRCSMFKYWKHLVLARKMLF